MNKKLMIIFIVLLFSFSLVTARELAKSSQPEIKIIYPLNLQHTEGYSLVAYGRSNNANKVYYRLDMGEGENAVLGNWKKANGVRKWYAKLNFPVDNVYTLNVKACNKYSCSEKSVTFINN